MLGASADLAAAFQQAKLEAAKRNDFVTVSVHGLAGAAWCIGWSRGDGLRLPHCDVRLSTRSMRRS